MHKQTVQQTNSFQLTWTTEIQPLSFCERLDVGHNSVSLHLLKESVNEEYFTPHAK
jgi:hypothetical protein